MTTFVSMYAKQVKDLVGYHRGLTRNGRLLFAVWYDRDNESGDVNLFEVYEEFPDPGIGKLETFLFPSNSRFPLKGTLKLTVTSPSELRVAIERNDPILAHIRDAEDKEVMYPESGEWDTVIERITQ